MKLYPGPGSRILLLLLTLLLAPTFLRAQTAATLRGQVTDPSGAAIPNATVILTNPSGEAVTVTTNRDGIYEAKDLAPGKYSVKIVASGFTAFENAAVSMTAGQTQKLDASLTLEVREEKVLVNDQAAA